MPENNAEIVRRAYAAAGRQPPDIEALIELFGVDHVLTTDWGTGDGREYVGLEGFQQVLADNAETWEDFGNDVVQAVEAADGRVALVIQATGRGRSSGIPVDRLVGALVTIRAGQLVSTHYYSDPADAFAAAGLEPPEL